MPIPWRKHIYCVNTCETVKPVVVIIRVRKAAKSICKTLIICAYMTVSVVFVRNGLHLEISCNKKAYSGAVSVEIYLVTYSSKMTLSNWSVKDYAIDKVALLRVHKGCIAVIKVYNV